MYVKVYGWRPPSGASGADYARDQADDAKRAARRRRSRFFGNDDSGQQAGSILGKPSEANHFIETPAGWVHPKTPWGEPDIQAMLNQMQANSLTLERCVSGGRGGRRPMRRHKGVSPKKNTSRWWRPPEAGRPGAGADRAGPVRPGAPVGRYRPEPAATADQPHRRSAGRQAASADRRRQASRAPDGKLVVDPGEDTVYEDPLDFDFWDNCRSRGMPSSMMPYRYNGGFRILQAPGVVVFDLEMIHDSRIIYTDGRPALGGPIKEYMGDRAAAGKATRSSSRPPTTRKVRRSSISPCPARRQATVSRSAIG